MADGTISRPMRGAALLFLAAFRMQAPTIIVA
jgi:hypothetical protein